MYSLPINVLSIANPTFRCNPFWFKSSSPRVCIFKLYDNSAPFLVVFLLLKCQFIFAFFYKNMKLYYNFTKRLFVFFSLFFSFLSPFLWITWITLCITWFFKVSRTEIVDNFSPILFTKWKANGSSFFFCATCIFVFIRFMKETLPRIFQVLFHIYSEPFIKKTTATLPWFIKHI